MKSKQKSTSRKSAGSGTQQVADQGSRSGSQSPNQQSDTGRQAKTDKKNPAGRSGNR